jgi:hypothetical protein
MIQSRKPSPKAGVLTLTCAFDSEGNGGVTEVCCSECGARIIRSTSIHIADWGAAVRRFHDEHWHDKGDNPCGNASSSGSPSAGSR